MLAGFSSLMEDEGDMSWDSYPLFSRDFQLDLLFPHLLPLAVVPAERSSLLLGLLLPGRLAEDVVVRSTRQTLLRDCCAK